MLSIHSSISPKAVAIHNQAGKVGIGFTRAGSFYKNRPRFDPVYPNFQQAFRWPFWYRTSRAAKRLNPGTTMTSIMARPTNWLSYEFPARKEDDNAAATSGKMLVSRLATRL
jgi:hypothetical protein